MLHPSSSYPIQGLWYFLRHPSLWWKCLLGLIISLVVALGLLGLFFALLPAQAHALIRAGCPSGLAWVVGVILCFLESGVAFLIFALIFVQFLVEGLVDFVWRDKGVPFDEDASCFKTCGVTTTLASVTFLAQLLVLILTIPINAVPVVGTVLFCYVNGFLYAWERQQRYDVEVKHFTAHQSWSYARRHTPSYGAFGSICYLLNLIPVANFLFIFTNAIGAALWSADQWKAEQKKLTRAAARQNDVPDGTVEATRAIMHPPVSGSGLEEDVLDVADGRAPPPPVSSGQHQGLSYGSFP